MGMKQVLKKIVHLMRRKEKIPIVVTKDKDCALVGKTAIISGGTGGLGKAITSTLVESGCKVILFGKNENKMMDFCGQFENGEVIYQIADVSNIHELEIAVSKVFMSYKIDILINCAGINDPTDFFSVDEKIYDKIMDVNLKGSFFLAQYVASRMIENGIKGHILNVSSASALRPASTPYAISKWGINGFTKGLADLLIPYGITVNAVAPGPTATPMLGKNDGDDISHEFSPAGRYTTPKEVAGLVRLLVSDSGDMIVGDTVYISGGSGTISLHR